MEISDENQPFGMMTVSQHILSAVFRPLGIATVFLVSTGWCMWQITNLPILLRLLPAFGYALVFFFSSFVFTLVAALGDFLAFYAMSKVYGEDCIRTTWQKILYFVLSSIGFVFAAIFVSLGDSPLTRALDQ